MQTPAVQLAIVLAMAALAVSYEQVLNNLNNPRKLAFDRRGNLFVSEAGAGLGHAPTNADTGMLRPEGAYYSANTASVSKFSRRVSASCCFNCNIVSKTMLVCRTFRHGR